MVQPVGEKGVTFACTTAEQARVLEVFFEEAVWWRRSDRGALDSSAMPALGNPPFDS
jgi:hypothetical protein